MTGRNLRDPAFFAEVYKILVKEAGADPDEIPFIHTFTSPADHREYRFSGRLGFGGKFWRSPGRPECPFYVNCYPEDSTPEREEIISRVNEQILRVFSRWT